MLCPGLVGTPLAVTHLGSNTKSRPTSPPLAHWSCFALGWLGRRSPSLTWAVTNEEEKVDGLRFHHRTPDSSDTRSASEAINLQVRRLPFRSLSHNVHGAVFMLCSAQDHCS